MLDDKIFGRIKDRITNEEQRIDEVAMDWHGVNTSAVFPQYEDLARSEDPDNKKAAKKLRKVGKVIGLSLLYQSSQGAAGYTIHDDLGLTPEQAQVHTDKWYKGVATFSASIKNIIRESEKTKTTKNSFNRIRHLPDIDGAPDRHGGKPNRKLVNYNKRLTINFPVQSTGADQIKLMLRNVDKFINNNYLSRYTINTMFRDRYDRIIAFDKSKSNNFDLFCDEVEQMPKGNIKLLVIDNNKVLQEFDRNITLHYGMIKKYNLIIIH